jgi:ubiquinone/menaquinone biosynthesis C-methylase UbiE
MNEPEGYLDHQKAAASRPNSFFIKSAQRRMAIMAKYVSAAKPPKAILDVGCRRAESTPYLQTLFPDTRIVGVDIVPEAVEEASQEIEAYVADAHDLSMFKDREFDWVFCSHTLEHCYDLVKAVDEVHRVSAHGVCIVVPLESQRHADDAHYVRSPDPITWLGWLTRRDWVMLLAVALDAGRADLVTVWIRREFAQFASDDPIDWAGEGF